MTPDPHGRLPRAYTTTGSSSFLDFVTAQAPHLLPGNRDGDGAVQSHASGSSPLVQSLPHATTIVALVVDGGVVMAGDRRATAGSMIAHREIEKVFPADEFSAVGIAGTAGIAIDLVRLFQLELEHYEKIEGQLLSLDGKANRLSTMIRSNLGLAMQGLAVVPLFAGYDLRLGRGRIFSFDVTGGRYEERDHHSVGSGSVFARGSLKKLWRPGLTADEGVAVAVEALFDAADDDSATAGPDTVRKIWPVVARVTEAGYARAADDELAPVVDRIVAQRGGEDVTGRGVAGEVVCDDHALLRLARAAHAGPGRLRAQGDRPGKVRGRRRVRRRDRVRDAEPVPGPAQDLGDLRPHRVRRGGQVQRVREPAGRRGPVRGPARVLLRPLGRRCPRAGERLRADARHGLHDRVEAARGRARRRGGRADRGAGPDLPALVRRDGRRRARVRGDGGRAEELRDHVADGWRPGMALGEVLRLAATALAHPGGSGAAPETDAGDTTEAPAAVPAAELEVGVLDRTRPRRAFRRLAGDTLAGLLQTPDAPEDTR
ncbi:hypothetical protein GCM10025865_28150 [Paraoerskovia sediminicola]|uniref:Proteasome subunit beta n=1 Tax=Paraoerskovia sediminicola TaxID=1138587 RepID=A0ABN6XIZ9_9CELL|nr:hypothetical protein GCM10025865_28150 [Paraoerskovia sediminicola]